MATKTLEVFLAVDSDGEFVVALDSADDADVAYDEGIGGCLPIRIVKLSVTLTLPEVTEASVTVPDSAGQTVEASAS